MLLTSPIVLAFLNMLPKAFTNLIIYLFYCFYLIYLIWAIIYCVLLTYFIVFNRCKQSIYIVICKYDLEKPFFIVNKSENNNKLVVWLNQVLFLILPTTEQAFQNYLTTIKQLNTSNKPDVAYTFSQLNFFLSLPIYNIGNIVFCFIALSTTIAYVFRNLNTILRIKARHYLKCLKCGYSQNSE